MHEARNIRGCESDRRSCKASREWREKLDASQVPESERTVVRIHGLVEIVRWSRRLRLPGLGLPGYRSLLVAVIASLPRNRILDATTSTEVRS